MTKQAPINTATEANGLTVLLEAMTTGDSGSAITNQEKQGKASFVSSDTLPADITNEDKANLEMAGVIFGEPVEGDPLFQYVTLPGGWQRVGSGHDMWSYLHDESGNERAAIFYKAAFHDRKAHLSIRAARD